MTSDETAAPRICNVPAWCHSPFLRGFVMANALAAPLLLISWGIAHVA